MKTADLRIPARSIRMLVQIKQFFLCNNEIAMKASNCGNIVVAHHIDDLIESAIKIETAYHNCRISLEIEREENEKYRALFEDYSPDWLTPAEQAEVKALVEKWRKADENEEA